MNKHLKLLGYLFACLYAAYVDAQYITLNGNRFHDQTGEPFYPVICNYGVRLSCQNCNTGTLISGFSSGRINCTPSDYTLHPNPYYGSTREFEEPFNKGLEKISADLTKIKEMGFNTVRVMMEFHENKHFKMDNGNVVSDEPGGRVICLKYDNAESDYNSWWGNFFRIMPPYTSDSNLHHILLPAIHNFLDVANNVGLQVILVTGGSCISASGDASYQRDGSVENLAQAEDYRDYMEVLTANLKNRTELLAYDLYNEMSYGIKIWNPNDPIPSNRSWGPSTTDKKEEICNFTAMWYDAIKAVDSNHLISISSGNIFGVFDYDPAIIKTDLHDYHEYPYNYIQGFELWGNFFTPAQIRERWLSRYEIMFYWQKNNNPTSWILSETAASAWTAQGQDVFGQNTNANAPGYTTNAEFVGKNFSQPPFSYGSYQDQLDFARQTQQMVLNHSGAGYGWWEFMWNERNAPFNSAKEFSEQFIGLLDRGDPAAQGSDYVYNNSLDRPVVAAFNTNPITKPQPGSGTMPDNYYNPFGGDSQTNYTITGKIVDQIGNPIKDAVLMARNNWGDTVVPDSLKFTIFTFSRENGTFQLTAPIYHITVTNPLDTANSIDYSKFLMLEYTAPAASKDKIFAWALPNGNGGNIGNLTLQRRANIFDKKVENLVINSGNSPIEITARNKLTLQNVTVESTGIADFHASDMVELLPGFEAAEGSFVDIYIAPVGFNCDSLTNLSYKTDETRFYKTDETNETPSEIIVHYTLERPKLKVQPNPASSIIYLEATEEGLYHIELSSMSGKTMLKETYFIQGSHKIDLNSLAPGNYILSSTLNGQTEFFKLVIIKN